MLPKAVTSPQERKKKMKMVINKNGTEINYEAAEMMMDDDLREEIHHSLAPCSPQLFFDTYCREHEKWELSKENPVW